MRDFSERLDTRLRVLAGSLPDGLPQLRVVAPPSSTPSARLPRTARRRRPRTLAGLTAAATVAASAVALTGSDERGLPILHTAVSDASALASSRALAGRDLDLRRGHRFGTPAGDGWIVLSRGGTQLCVTAPDALTGTLGAACAPRAQVERKGLTLEAVDDLGRSRDATSLVVHVLPVGAVDARLSRSAGASTPVPTRDGVVVSTLRSPATLSYRVGPRTVRTSFAGPFTGGTLECGGFHASPWEVESAANPKPGQRRQSLCDAIRAAQEARR